MIFNINKNLLKIIIKIKFIKIKFANTSFLISSNDLSE